MKLVKLLVICVVALTLALPSAALAAKLPKFVYIATNPQGSLYYTFGGIFAKVIDTYSGMKSRVQPSGGSSAYIPAISQGKIELGINNTNDVALAYRGVKPFIHSPKIRVLSVVCPLVAGMLVRNDSDIKTMEDMKGKKVAAKFPAQVSIVKCIEGMMAANNMSYDDVEQVPVENIIDGVQALTEKRLDATSISIYAGRTKEADATIPGGVRYLSIDGSPEAAKRMAEVFPGSYPLKVKAHAPGSVGILSDLTLQAYDVYFISSSNLSDDAVYAVVKAMYEHLDELQKGHGMLRFFTKDDMVKENVTAPYHPGAIKFYKEMGMWSPEMDKVQEALLNQ